MSSFDISEKLVHLLKTTMENSHGSIMVRENLMDAFDIKRGFRKGDAPYCGFFNIILRRVFRISNVKVSGTIFERSVQLRQYADDIDIIGSAQGMSVERM